MMNVSDWQKGLLEVIEDGERIKECLGGVEND